MFDTAANEHILAERELQAAGDLFPKTVSIGDPYSGLPGPVFSSTHEEIECYTPADMFPSENEREHAELSAAISRRDARLLPAEEARDAAWDAERDALAVLVQTIPTTTPGVMAMLEFHRDWRDGDDALEVDYLSCLIESVHLALVEIQSA